MMVNKIKRTLILVLCFTFSMTYLHSQEHIQTNDSIYKMAEIAPSFGESEADIFKYIAEHVVYPDSARALGAQGMVCCEFVVEKDGSLSHLKVVRSAHNEWLDAEAVRVISSMPQWKPGQIAGEQVRTRYFLPVNFKIQAPLTSTSDANKEKLTVDKMPDFPGGQEGLDSYIETNLKYPYEAMLNNIQGQAIVSFLVNIDGSISETSIARTSGDHLLDAEALRVVHSMPNWSPAEKDGQPIGVTCEVPINFSLNDNMHQITKIKHTNAAKVLQDYLNKHFEFEPIKSGVNDIYRLDITIPLKITIDSTGMIKPILQNGEIRCEYKIINGRETILQDNNGRKIKTLSKTTFLDNASVTGHINHYCNELKPTLAQFIKTMDAADIKCTPTKRDGVPICETITITLYRDGLKKYNVKPSK